MNGVNVTYVGTAQDGRCIRATVHHCVSRVTLLEAQALRAQLDTAIEEARRREPDPVARAHAKTVSTVVRLFGPRP